MAEVLQVVKKNAIKAFNSADKAGKKLLSDLFEIDFSGKLIDWVKTFEDICMVAGEDPNDYVFPSGASYKQKRDICLSRIELIAKVLNEGWIEDIADTSQRKYYPYFNIINDKSLPGGFRLSFVGSDYAYDYSYVGVRPSYKNSEISDFAGRTFLPQYQELALNQKLFLTNQ